MYHALLTNRYLTSRVIPLIAVAAVALCVALVIIVVSVMTGFLNMVRDSGRTLIGDVVISYPVSGIPHYERLIERLTRLPEVEAAAPMVESWGLLRMPYPDGPYKETEYVQFWGIDESFAAVTGYAQTIYWKELQDWQRELLINALLANHWRTVLSMVLDVPWSQQVELLSAKQRDELRDHLPQSHRALFDSKLESTTQRELLATLTSAQWRRLLLTDDHDLYPFAGRLNQALSTLDFEFLIAALSENPQDLLRQQLGAGDGQQVLDSLSKEDVDELLTFEPRLGNPDDLVNRALQMTTSESARSDAVLGIHISQANKRNSDGEYEPMLGGYWWMPSFAVTLTTIPTSGGGFAEPESAVLQVVNEFMSGVYLIDEKRVMIPLDVAQKMLHLDQADILDDDEEEVIGIEPARATTILVRAIPGISPVELRNQVSNAYDAFYDEIALDAEIIVKPPRGRGAGGFGLSVLTWEQQQAKFIGPVEKERELMRTLFSLVYLVCAGLVLAIFWAIVYEKTRDIGILRSIGASRLGISWIFLRYGLVVGVLGAISGVGLAYLVVHNINAIHDALGDPPMGLAWTFGAAAVVALLITIFRSLSGRMLPLVLGILITIVLLIICVGISWLHYLHEQGRGIVVWDPSVYYFSRIPNEMDMAAVITTMIGAVIFSLIGAFLPAAKAADTDPITALRYE